MKGGDNESRGHDVVYSIPLIERDGRLCVVLGLKEEGRYPKPYWTLPGSGHVEPGETLTAALRRELGEELNVGDALIDDKPLGTFVDDGYSPPHIIHVFVVRLNEVPETSDEIVEIKIIRLEEACNFIEDNVVSPTVIKALDLMSDMAGNPTNPKKPSG